MFFLITVKDNSYNHLDFKFGDWKDASAFIDTILVHGEHLTARVEFALEFEEEEDKE